MENEIQSAFAEEQQQLQTTLEEINRQLGVLQEIPRYYGNDLTEQALDNIREGSRRNLAIARKEPYFGRLEFQENGAEKPIPLYIGKVGVESDDSNRLLVIDWRAPVASMFYSFTGTDEPAAYESPEGIVEGLVYLKRNLVIRQQILERVVDSYVRGKENLNVTDEFLLYRLEENKDNRLRDIVSTIQEEQDSIIRASKNQALVIQGVAGSGKTTVALHRLAYLLYRYRENVRPERMIIFAPNSMFLDYISGVLPELGVGDIQQTTFSDWALELLDHEVKLADPAAQHAHWFAVGRNRPEINDMAPGRYKGSVQFLAYLDECLREYEASYLPETDFEPWDGKRLANAMIREWFYTEYKHYPLAKRRERLIGRIKRWLEMELDKKGTGRAQRELRKKALQKFKAYQKTLPDYTPFKLYRELSTGAAKTFKRGEVQLEDLAPLVYIHQRMHGIESAAYFDHVVIDEAQDFSPFQVAVLKEQTRGNSFSLLGDLSQGIHTYQGINDWAEFLDLFGESESAFFRLNRSYRSTMEIIHFANEIIARSGEDVTKAVPVFRSGEKVHVVRTAPEARLTALAETVSGLQAGGAKTVAVIGRTDEQCVEIQRALQGAGLDAALIDSKRRDYGGGLSVMPVYLAKGLEFDAVILADVDAENYLQNPRDAKLLYVGCTRALHKLWLFHGGDPSPLIKDLPAELYTEEFGSQS